MSSAEPLDLNRLRALLTTQRVGRVLEYVLATESTNADALRHVQQLRDRPVPHGMVFLAETQRAGRGRRGRSWYSPPAGNIYCSVIIAPGTQHDLSAQAMPWTPLASAVAAADSLSPYPVPVALKWPNDVLLGGKKLGGILCEQTTTADKVTAVIVGIGLNINGDLQAMPPDLRATATSLAAELGSQTDRAALLADLFAALEQRLDRLWQEGPASIAADFTRRCATLGKQVKVSLGAEGSVEGLAESIGDGGCLRLRVTSKASGLYSQRILEVRSGDVVHLR